MAEAMSEERQYLASEIDNWWSDAPITDRQLDTVRGDLDNELKPEGWRFHPQVVRKLLAEIDRLRADRPPLTDEYGLRIRHISTLTEERAIADTLGGALEVLEAFDAQGRESVVSRELLVRGVEEWRKAAEG